LIVDTDSDGAQFASITNKNGIVSALTSLAYQTYATTQYHLTKLSQTLEEDNNMTLPLVLSLNHCHLREHQFFQLFLTTKLFFSLAMG
jgi:hypothetical protein